jgi:hypothetical protein
MLSVWSSVLDTFSNTSTGAGFESGRGSVVATLGSASADQIFGAFSESDAAKRLCPPVAAAEVVGTVFTVSLLTRALSFLPSLESMLSAYGSPITH